MVKQKNQKKNNDGGSSINAANSASKENLEKAMNIGGEKGVSNPAGQPISHQNGTTNTSVASSTSSSNSSTQQQQQPSAQSQNHQMSASSATASTTAAQKGNLNSRQQKREKTTSGGSQNYQGGSYRGNCKGGGEQQQQSQNNRTAREKDSRESGCKSNNHLAPSNKGRQDKYRDNSSQSRRGHQQNSYYSASNSSNTGTKSKETSITVPIGGGAQAKKPEKKETVAAALEKEKEKKTVPAAPVQQEQAEKPALKHQSTEMEALPESSGFGAERRIERYSDTVLAFTQHSDWDKVELLCELMNLVNPLDLRLVGNCIEGLARNTALQLKPIESRANSDNPISVFPSPNCQLAYLNVFNPTQTTKVSQKTVATTNGSSYGGPATPTTNGSKESQGKNGQKGEEENVAVETNKEGQKAGEIGEQGANKPPVPIAPNGAYPITAHVEKPTAFLNLSKILESLYALVALLNSANRRSAHQVACYVDSYILASRQVHLDQMPGIMEKMVVLQSMGKIVSACIHHPAFAVPDKMRYTNARDDIRCELKELENIHEQEKRVAAEQDVGMHFVSKSGVGRRITEEEEDEEEDDDKESGTVSDTEEILREGSEMQEMLFNRNGFEDSLYKPFTFNNKTSTGTMAFITRFKAKKIDGESQNCFHIAIHWSDGETTYTIRTRNQVWDMHRRLLDPFGMEQYDKQKPDNRILPRLQETSTADDVVQYLNDLSDLPARMMLSQAISDEFNATRLKTVENEDDMNGMILARLHQPAYLPRREPPTHPITSTSKYATTIEPLLYGTVPHAHNQICEQSCSNCAGNHPNVLCDKPFITERKREEPFSGEFKLDMSVDPATAAAAAAAASQQNGAQTPTTPFNQSFLLPPYHFLFHHNLQQQQQGRVLNYFPRGIMGPNPQLMYLQPQSVPPSQAPPPPTTSASQNSSQQPQFTNGNY